MCLAQDGGLVRYSPVLRSSPNLRIISNRNFESQRSFSVLNGVRYHNVVNRFSPSEYRVSAYPASVNQLDLSTLRVGNRKCELLNEWQTQIGMSVRNEFDGDLQEFGASVSVGVNAELMNRGESQLVNEFLTALNKRNDEAQPQTHTDTPPAGFLGPSRCKAKSRALGWPRPAKLFNTQSPHSLLNTLHSVTQNKLALQAPSSYINLSGYHDTISVRSVLQFGGSFVANCNRRNRGAQQLFDGQMVDNIINTIYRTIKRPAATPSYIANTHSVSHLIKSCRGDAQGSELRFGVDEVGLACRWLRSSMLAQIPFHCTQVALNNASRFNLTWDETLAYRQLVSCVRNRQLIVRKADKSSQLVLMDVAKYDAACQHLLDDTVNYEMIPFNLNRKCAALIKQIIIKYKRKKVITQTQADKLLVFNSSPRPRQFYGLPKTHKPRDKWLNNMPPIRPICGDVRSETAITGQLITKWLTPYFKLIPSFILNSFQLINLLKDLVLPDSAVFVVADVESLYPNIPIREAWNRICRATGTETLEQQFLLELLEIHLRHNYFEFNSKFYKQIKGIPMGRAWAPAVASLYLAEWEAEVFRSTGIEPLLYRRYIDDVIFIMRSNEEADTLIEAMQSLDTNIRITDIQRGHSVHYLDLLLTIQSGTTISWSLYQKPSDLKLLIDYKSGHSRRVKDNVILSQMIRFARLHKYQSQADMVIREFTLSMHMFRHVPQRSIRRIWNTFVSWRNRNFNFNTNSWIVVQKPTNTRKRLFIPVQSHTDVQQIRLLISAFCDLIPSTHIEGFNFVHLGAKSLLRVLFHY